MKIFKIWKTYEIQGQISSSVVLDQDLSLVPLGQLNIPGFEQFPIDDWP